MSCESETENIWTYSDKCEFEGLNDFLSGIGRNSFIMYIMLRCLFIMKMNHESQSRTFATKLHSLKFETMFSYRNIKNRKSKSEIRKQLNDYEYYGIMNHNNILGYIKIKPKFKILASGVFAHTRNTLFPKYWLSLETCFTNKMCLFNVRKDKICTEQRSVFVKVFLYDICIWKMIHAFHRQKNTISRCVHIRVVQHMVVKTPTCTKLSKNVSQIYIYIFKLV